MMKKVEGFSCILLVYIINITGSWCCLDVHFLLWPSPPLWSRASRGDSPALESGARRRWWWRGRRRRAEKAICYDLDVTLVVVLIHGHCHWIDPSFSKNDNGKIQVFLFLFLAFPLSLFTINSNNKPRKEIIRFVTLEAMLALVKTKKNKEDCYSPLEPCTRKSKRMNYSSLIECKRCLNILDRFKWIMAANAEWVEEEPSKYKCYYVKMFEWFCYKFCSIFSIFFFLSSFSD